MYNVHTFFDQYAWVPTWICNEFQYDHSQSSRDSYFSREPFCTQLKMLRSWWWLHEHHTKYEVNCIFFIHSLTLGAGEEAGELVSTTFIKHVQTFILSLINMNEFPWVPTCIYAVSSYDYMNMQWVYILPYENIINWFIASMSPTLSSAFYLN